MDISGYADHPIEKIEDDSLKMSDYVNGLSDFIKCCETPMTIAIKGEWGSGKTSLMRMIQNNLTKKTAAKDSPKSTVAEQTAKDISKDTVAVQTANNASENMVAEQTANNATKATDTKQTANNVLEEPVIIPVWFDTWKFSAMELGNQLAISMLGEILHALDCDSITIRAMLGGIAKLAHATLPLITEVSMGFASLGEAMRNLIRINEKESFGTEIRELQNRFHEIVQRKIKREKARRNNDQEYLKETKDPNFIKKTKFYYRSIKEKLSYKTNYECLPKDRVIIFIDDLDRIQPDKAVDLLEILKAFLDCPNCVFVLAIDFELVSLGVNIKYKNNLSAEKSKDFFDKMVQLPFTMPTTNYDLDSYIKKLNISEGETFIEEIKQFIELSVGVNPRKIKRIFNTYNLNRNNILIKFSDINKEFINKCVFALACMQEQYPDFLTFLANNDFDRFVFEPFLQPDVTAVNQYHDIFENRDETYIKQQLAGLRKFVPVLKKIFILPNGDYAKLIEKRNRKYNGQLTSSGYVWFMIKPNNGNNDQANKDLDECKNLLQEIDRLLPFNINENYHYFKEIIKLISVSNLGILINPSLQDVANNEEWFLREKNIEYVKRIIQELWNFERERNRIKGKHITPVKWRYEKEKDKNNWSILTPIKTKDGIKISDITAYQKYTSNMYFDYKFEFKLHEESIKFNDKIIEVNNKISGAFKESQRSDEWLGYICFDFILHVYPHNDLQKDSILNLMGNDPLLLMKKPNIKLSEDEFHYHYFNVIKLFRRLDDNIEKPMVELITSILENTLFLFQSRCKEDEIKDEYKNSIINNLAERVKLLNQCNYQGVYDKEYLEKINSKAKIVAENAKTIIVNKVTDGKAKDDSNVATDKKLLVQIDDTVMLHYFLNLDEEQISLSLLREVYGSEVIDAWQLLMYKKSKSIDSFINGIQQNVLASVVIVADIEENLLLHNDRIGFLHGKYGNLDESVLKDIYDFIKDRIK